MLFVPYSVPGHVHPMLPLIRELAVNGEQVRVLVGTRFAAAVEHVGGRVVPLRWVPDVFVPERVVGRDSARWAAGRLARLVVNRRAAAVLAAELRGEDRPDLLVVDVMLGWADRVARRWELPTAMFSSTFYPGPAALAEVVRGDGWFVPPWVHRFRPLARRAARPGRPILANASADLQPAHDRLPAEVHLVGPLTSGVAGSVGREGGGRVVYVSPGTVFARGLPFFQRIVRAFAGTGWSVFLATGHLDPAELGRLPPGMVARRVLPQRDLLAVSDVFITHAGMNSVQEALAAGVPMMFVPRSAEQRHLARRLVQAGVGVWAAVSPDPALLLIQAEQLAADQAVRAALADWQHRNGSGVGAPAAGDLLRRIAAGVR